jgi:transaldolase
MGILSLPSLFEWQWLIAGASFRNTGEILELAGCDYLTISPALLDELQKTEGKVPKKLDANQARDLSIKKVSYIDNEADFR